MELLSPRWSNWSEGCWLQLMCCALPCTNSKGKAQCVETNAQVYCNVPKGKAEPNVSVTTTTLSECAETYLSVLKQTLR